MPWGSFSCPIRATISRWTAGLASLNVGGIMWGYSTTLKGGSIVASSLELGVTADNTYAPTALIATGNIGSVWSRSALAGSIVAGTNMGRYNNNAVIQNVLTTWASCWAPWYSRYAPNMPINGMWSSGSIGTVHVTGAMGGPDDGTITGLYEITINGDDLEDDAADYGAYSYLDLLAVGGAWHSNVMLLHGPNADIRMVTVGGQIDTLNSSALHGITVTDGSSTPITDDGNGMVQGVLPPGYLTGTDGLYIYRPDAFGHPSATFTTYTYIGLPVYDYEKWSRQGMLNERGVVLETVTLDGPAILSLDKPGDCVDVGNLAMTMTTPAAQTANAATPGGVVSLNGNGELNVYSPPAPTCRTLSTTPAATSSPAHSTACACSAPRAMSATSWATAAR